MINTSVMITATAECGDIAEIAREAENLDYESFQWRQRFLERQTGTCGGAGFTTLGSLNLLRFFHDGSELRKLLGDLWERDYVTVDTRFAILLEQFHR